MTPENTPPVYLEFLNRFDIEALGHAMLTKAKSMGVGQRLRFY